MIKFDLKCGEGHQFESWFQSADAFDKLKSAGMVTCAICGNASVEKAIMAPRVQASRKRAVLNEESDSAPLSTPGTAAEKAMKDWKKHVEENSEYVGMSFAAEARDMHDGVTPERAIHGEAKPEEARKLMEDGVPVAPLPFVLGRKTN
ncbi:MAG: DUF1178 family protein [Pseudomonadota bacterium]